MNNTNTKLLGIIGDPISHSLSPILHNFVIQKLGLNYSYHAFHIKPKELEKVISAFQLLKLIGINVTIPHKEKIIKDLDEVSEHAQNLGAVNTVLFSSNRSFGDNTDWIGFQKSLQDFQQHLK